MIVGSPVPPGLTSTLPAMVQFRKDMTAAGFGEGDTINFGLDGVTAWAETYTLAKIAARIKGDVTSAKMFAAIKELKKPIDVMGLATWNPRKRGPSAYPNVAAPSIFPLIAKSGHFTQATPQAIGDLWTKFGLSH